jgi:hypothetical protein
MKANGEWTDGRVDQTEHIRRVSEKIAEDLARSAQRVSKPQRAQEPEYQSRLVAWWANHWRAFLWGVLSGFVLGALLTK